MIEHVWSVLCEQALENPKNRTTSYINTLDNLPIKSVNRETGHLAIQPFLIATKWKKNAAESVKLSIKIDMSGKSTEKTELFGAHEIEIGEGAAIAAINIEVDKMIVEDDSKYDAFEIMYKYDKQRNYRVAAVLPFAIHRQQDKPNENVDK